MKSRVGLIGAVNYHAVELRVVFGGSAYPVVFHYDYAGCAWGLSHVVACDAFHLLNDRYNGELVELISYAIVDGACDDGMLHEDQDGYLTWDVLDTDYIVSFDVVKRVDYESL